MNNSFSEHVSASPHAENRRAPRSKVHIPVFVYGHNASEAPFHEDAYSAVVSESGALLIMTTPVAIGDKLLLTNKATEDQQECRVASLSRRNGPTIEVGVEFSAPASEFWHLTAPPRSAESVPEAQKRSLA
jgi:hypothetical protein